MPPTIDEMRAQIAAEQEVAEEARVKACELAIDQFYMRKHAELLAAGKLPDCSKWDEPFGIEAIEKHLSRADRAELEQLLSNLYPDWDGDWE